MNRFPVENIDKVAAAVKADSANKATKLANAKNIKLTGDVTGSASFNGTSDANITVTIADDSHSHIISNIDGLQDTLDNITKSITSSGASAGTSLAVNGTTLQLKDSSGNVLSTVTTQDTKYTLPSATSSILGGVKLSDSTNSSSDASAGVAATPKAVSSAVSGKANDADVVKLTGDQTIAGTKTFSSTITTKLIKTNNSFETNVAVSGTSIDVSTGSTFTKTISTATTFTFTGAVSGKVAVFSLILTNGGSKTVTWPSSVKWADDTVPNLTASGVDVITFMTNNGGTTWYGVPSILNAK